MTDWPDQVLLEQFARNHSEAAFAVLVQRHLSLVHSVALRHTSNPELAQDISQAVFIILARKAGGLGGRTVLPGWLYHTARLTAANFQRAEARRLRREQEAFMQSTTETTPADDLWRELSPQLDAAMAGLGANERDALVLRYFQNQSMAEVGRSLGWKENTAQQRVGRALEKLRKFFGKRGLTLSAAAIAGIVSAHSVQAAPTGLAPGISAVALTKGAAAGTSTLTLVKGALKLMAWSKVKTAAVTGVCLLLAAGTTVITTREIQEHRTYSWELASFDPVPTVAPTVLWKTSPQVRLKPSNYDHFIVGFTDPGIGAVSVDGKMVQTNFNRWQSIGVGETVREIVRTAYDADERRLVFLHEAPKGLYDYISNLPAGTQKPLQELIAKKLGLAVETRLQETDVLVLKLVNPDAGAFQPAGSLLRTMKPGLTLDSAQLAFGDSQFMQTKTGTTETRFNTPVHTLVDELENNFQLPVVDETGLTNRYDFTITWPVRRTDDNEAYRKILNATVLNQLGLALEPDSRSIEMLVVDRAD